MTKLYSYLRACGFGLALGLFGLVAMMGGAYAQEATVFEQTVAGLDLDEIVDWVVLVGAGAVIGVSIAMLGFKLIKRVTGRV